MTGARDARTTSRDRGATRGDAAMRSPGKATRVADAELDGRGADGGGGGSASSSSASGGGASRSGNTAIASGGAPAERDRLPSMFGRPKLGAPLEGGLGGGGDSTVDPTLNPDTDDSRDKISSVEGRPQDTASGWGTPLGSCHGVPAFKNVIDDAQVRTDIATRYGGYAGDDKYGLSVNTPTGLAYQCVEFVTRYYRDALGHSGIGAGHGKTFLDGTRGGLEVHRFPSPTRPQAGDLVVQQEGTFGHVGIVESVTGTAPGDLTINVVQQNKTAAESSFTVTGRRLNRMEIASFEVHNSSILYAHSGPWSGFRRKAGTTPVDTLGGTSQSAWFGPTPDLGAGNYRVAEGESIALWNVASMYGVTVADLLAWNPGMANTVTGPAEIRVTAPAMPPQPIIGRTVIDTHSASVRTANVRSGPSQSDAVIDSLPQGRGVLVYEIRSTESGRWFRIRTSQSWVSEQVCGEYHAMRPNEQPRPE